MNIAAAATKHLASTAVRHPVYGSFSYELLLAASETLASQVTTSLPARRGSDGPRIGVYAEPGPAYVAATWASWLAGGIAVPLAVSHPPHELQYVMEDAGISTVIAPPHSWDKLVGPCSAAGAQLHTAPEILLQPQNSDAPHNAGSSSSNGRQAPTMSGLQEAPHSGPVTASGSSGGDAGALIVYTSGTTGRPKGALHTHGSLSAQVSCLVSAWGWSCKDTIVHALPLHHVHGIINALYCAHAVGATVNFLPKFSPAALWQQLMSGDISVLMAVPTMYSYLLAYYEHLTPEEQARARAAAGRLRLTVSGSAAAPVPLLQQWQQVLGQVLLERYGMTETGMILSNPYQGERRPGFVGLPLPGVQVKVVQPHAASSDACQVDELDDQAGMQGELAVKGPMLFREYWGRPEATAAAFDAEGFFLTGDTVALDGNPPYFKIMGRTSVDIIKSGGYKLSALDIESTLLHHPGVAEAAVLGVPHERLGQLVMALVHPKNHTEGSCAGSTQDLVMQLQQLCERQLPSYSVPQQWMLLEKPLPRNAMGKVNKKELLKVFASK